VSRKPSLKEVGAVPAAGSINLFWDSKRPSPPLVRILRSSDWYPATADDAQRGDYGAVQIYEGSAAVFVDRGLETGNQFFYSLFTRDGRGDWSTPVTVNVWTVAEPGHAAEVRGDHRSGATQESRRLAIDSAMAAFMTAAVVASMATSGIAYRIAAAAAIALVIGWRLVAGADADTGSLMRWLAVPAVAGAFALAASLLIALMNAVVSSSMTVALYPGNALWLLCIPSAMLGFWLFAGMAFVEEADRSWKQRALMVVVPAGVALAFPDLVLLAGALMAAGALAIDRNWVKKGEPTPTPPAAAATASDPSAMPPDPDLPVGSQYRCPRHRLVFPIPHADNFARQYEVASNDGECLCPGTTPWFVRAGVSRRDALFWLLLGLWILNFADLLLTWRSVVLGGARELNVFMARVLSWGIGPAFLVKIGIVTVGAAVIWRLRGHPRTLEATMMVAAAYAAVVVYQVLGLLVL
jgi:hypothetical protein